MKSLCNSLALAGALLGSSARLVDARLGSENDNADSASNERKLQTSQRRRLDLLNKMFSGMVDGAGAMTTQLDQYIGDMGDASSSEFDLSSVMELMGNSDSFGDMSSMMEAMMNPVNFTDIFNRCCASDATVIGATEYDRTSTESCNCPVRNVAPFETKWDEKCISSVGVKALAEINGEAELKTGMEVFMEAMADKDMDKDMDFAGMMDGGDFDFSGMMDGGFGDAFGDMMESIFGPVNYTDVQNRCCSDGGSSAYDLDPSSCNCPVRNDTKFLTKWEEQCTTKIAMKAAEEEDGGGSATAETDGSGAFDLGSMMDGIDMDLESFFESLFGKSVNYTQVYDNCCKTAEGYFDTAYSTKGTSSCKCPVRQSNPKWETACADKIVPKLTEA